MCQDSNNLIIICISKCSYSMILSVSSVQDDSKCVFLLNVVMDKIFHSGAPEMTSVFRDAVTVNISEKWLLLSVSKSDDAFVAS